MFKADYTATTEAPKRNYRRTGLFAVIIVSGAFWGTLIYCAVDALF